MVESRDVDRLEGLGKNVVEAALRDAARQRHLAAFKSDADTAAGARFLALVAPAAGLAVAGADASSLTLGNVRAAGGGRKFVHKHTLGLLILP